MKEKYKTLEEFYPYYLTQHNNYINRILHFIGTSLVLAIFGGFIYSLDFWLLIYIPFAGYMFAWVGHFFFEKNKPATFKYPLFSLISDFKMFFELLILKIPFDPSEE